MISKGKISLILSLCCMTVISIGFSSWVISHTDTAEVNGNIKVENVISNKDVIKNFEVVNAFAYTEMGFLTSSSNGYLTSRGIIEVQYKIDIDECERYFVSDKTLVISPTLKYTSDTVANLNNIFINNNLVMTYLISDVQTVSESSQWIEINPNCNDNNCATSIDIDNYLNNDNSLANVIYLSLKYTFTIQSGLDFKDTIGQVDDCKFVLTTMITSKE